MIVFPKEKKNIKEGLERWVEVGQEKKGGKSVPGKAGSTRKPVKGKDCGSQ